MEQVDKKFVVIGDGYVGKTCILHALQNLEFSQTLPNIFDDLLLEEKIHDKLYRIHFIDTAGQEEYDGFRKLFYKDADVILICFSVVDRSSFENITSKWLPDLENYKHIPLVLIGTKLDLRTNNRQCISREEARAFQKRIRALYYIECSSKNNIGISELKKCAFKIARENKKSCTVQ